MDRGLNPELFLSMRVYIGVTESPFVSFCVVLMLCVCFLPFLKPRSVSKRLM